MKRLVKISLRKSRVVVFGMVVLCLVVVGTAVGGTIYVDGSASGSADGSSWADAYNYLQDALADAKSLGEPVEIWVAAGTYEPDVNSAVPGGSGDQNATFQLINGVTIYGGFAGGEASLDERDWETNETVLSGDLAGDDDLVIEPGTGGGIPGENCAEAGPINRGETAFSNIGSTTDGPGDCPTYQDIWYVYTAEYTGYYRVRSVQSSSAYSPGLSVYEGATCPPTVLLACGTTRVSFTATEDTDYLIRVGSQFSYSEGTGTIIITRDVLADNSYHVVTGSGTDANAILDGLTITGGVYVVGKDGGGMYNDNGSPTVANCTFSGNSARNGGGMSNHDSNPTITNCIFSQNSAVGADGGGMYNDNSSPTITNCTFSENSANDDGGGTYGGGPFTNCTFIANSANGYSTWPEYGYGGGSCGNGSFTNCTFIGNSALDRGGGSNGGGPFTNCTFSGNSAGNGGGMYNGIGSPTLTNCTFSGNSTAADNGGGIYNNDINSRPALTNCILWGNEAGGWLVESNQIGGGFPVVHYTCVQGWTGLLGGLGNHGDDPLLVDADGADDILGTEDDNLRLSAGSACIDAGVNAAVPSEVSTDLNGFPRFIDDLCTVDTSNGVPPIVDMGAYEFLRSDIDSNGDVNLKDFSQFALYWLDIGCGVCGGADLTCDGDVNGDDLKEFAVYWLEGAD